MLEAALFCVTYFGLFPRLANERLEAGENRLDKTVEMVRNSKYSIHDLSRCYARNAGDCFRMNMPFEFGIDVGLRRSGTEPLNQKKFMVFEDNRHDLKAALSDISGQDVEFHGCDHEIVIKKVRDFFRVEAKIPAPGPARIEAEYATFQGWMTEKKIFEGHSESKALNLPTRERLDEMHEWVRLGNPSSFKAN